MHKPAHFVVVSQTLNSVTVCAPCACGHAECFFTATIYDKDFIRTGPE